MKKHYLILLLTATVSLGDLIIPRFAGVTGNNLVPNAELYLRLNEASGNATDSTSNGRTLTESGTVGSDTGVVGDARTFVDDDETDYLYRASESVFGFTGDFTITAWVDLDNTPPAIDDKTIISRGNYAGANFSWALIFDNASPDDKFIFYWSTDGVFNAGNVVEFTLSGDASTGDFYFLAVRRTGTTIHISATYRSDPLESDVTATCSGAFFDDGTNELRVGSLEGSTIHDMRGKIDEVGIWSRYLNDCEIAKLFTAKSGSFTWPSFDSNPCVL